MGELSVQGRLCFRLSIGGAFSTSSGSEGSACRAEAKQHQLPTAL